MTADPVKCKILEALKNYAISQRDAAEAMLDSVLEAIADEGCDDPPQPPGT